MVHTLEDEPYNPFLEADERTELEQVENWWWRLYCRWVFDWW